MTTIVAVIDKNHVYMGADSAIIAGTMHYIDPESKLLQHTFDDQGEDRILLMGYTGTSRSVDIIRDCFAPPIRPTEDDLSIRRYLVSSFITKMKDQLRKHGALTTSTEKDENGRELMDGMLMVACRDTIHLIYSDFGMINPSDRYAAIGSGAEIAYGALYVTDGQLVEHRIQAALGAATYFDSSTSGPFTVASTDPDFQA